MNDALKYYDQVGTEAESLLAGVLRKEINDEQLTEKILESVRSEIGRKKQVTEFRLFCERCPLPNLADDTLKEIERRFIEAFGAGAIQFEVTKQFGLLAVEYKAPGIHVIESVVINGTPLNEDEIQPEVKVKFVPFPVALPGDPEMVWIFAKSETMTNDEAARALHEAQVEFWESRSGQLQLRKGAERTFPEFAQRVPASLLREQGLKRHYKDPEVIKVLIKHEKR